MSVNTFVSPIRDPWIERSELIREFQIFGGPSLVLSEIWKKNGPGQVQTKIWIFLDNGPIRSDPKFHFLLDLVRSEIENFTLLGPSN